LEAYLAMQCTGQSEKSCLENLQQRHIHSEQHGEKEDELIGVVSDLRHGG
jgi:hypothetical protein